MGEVFEQTTNFVNPDKGEIELWSLTVEDGLTPKSERYNREFLVKKNANFKKVRPGDIVYNPMNMTLGAVGYNGMLKNVAVSGYYITMFVKTGYDSYYINTWLKSPQALSLYKTFATGSLIEKQRVQFSTLSIIPTVFPEYEEQKRIGCYFNNLDSLITFHHRKLNILNKICRYAWEQRKLGELGSVSMCKRIFKEQTTEQGDVPFFKIGTFGGKADAFISQELFEEYKAKYPYPTKGAILISASGSIGRTVEFTGGNEYFQDSNIVWLTHDERLQDTFLKYLYETVKWAGIEGSTIKRLYNDNILKTEIKLPTIAEQKQIGSFFCSLDDLITLHQREHKSNFRRKTNVKQSTRDRPFLLLLCSVDKGLQRGSGP